MQRRNVRELNQLHRFDFEKLEDRNLLSGSSGLFHVDIDHSTAVPVITSGDANGTPPITPADLIDPNVAESPWAGVVALNPNGNNVCTGTVLSPTIILTAAHCTDFSGDGTVDISLSATQVFFHHQDDAIVQTGVANIINHPNYTGFANPAINDDLALIFLTNPVPDGVPIYKFNQTEWTDPELIHLVGYGTSGDAINGYTIGAGHEDKRVGQNFTQAFETDDEGSATREIFLIDNDGPDLTTDALGDGGTLGNDNEVFIGGGDSGGPSFTWADADGDGNITPDELTLFGVNTFTGGGGLAGAPFYGSQGGGMNVSAYTDWLSEFIAFGEVEVSVNNNVVETGSAVDFGVTNEGGTLTKTITVTNREQVSNLTLVDPINITSDFTILESFGQTVLAPGESTEFTVRFDSNSVGNHTGTLSFENSDSDENPFTLELFATVAPPIGEAGTLIANRAWTTVFLRHTYIEPVIVAGPATANDADPVTVRIRNVTPDSFQIRVHEWQYLSGQHVGENVSYVVMESGVHRLSGGTTIIAQNSDGISTEFGSIPFELGFTEKPIVLTQVTTVNGGSPVITRVNNVAPNSFEVKLQEEEAADGTHTPETISWLAFVPDSDDLGVLTQLSESHDNSVGHDPVAFPFGGSTFDAAPVFLAGMQSYRGSNTATLRLANLNDNNATLYVEEEQSKDAEIGHGKETIGFLALDHGDIIGRTIIGEAGHIDNLDRAWQTIQLKQDYLDPVVILSINSTNETDPGVARVRNLTINSFDVHLEEWNYLDLNHAPELVSYIVFESGIHRLPDGTVIEARNSMIDSEFSSVKFSADHEGVPMVFSQVASGNGPATVTTRMNNITADGFDIKVQEEEAQATRQHVDETVSWVAIKEVRGDVSRMAYESKPQIGGVNHKGETVFFTTLFGEVPALVTSMQSYHGDNTASVRHSMISTGRFDLFIEEEQSLDAEVGHGKEDVSYFAMTPGIIDGFIIDLFGDDDDGGVVNPPGGLGGALPPGSSHIAVSAPVLGRGVDAIQQMLLARESYVQLNDFAIQQSNESSLFHVPIDHSTTVPALSGALSQRSNNDADYRQFESSDNTDSGDAVQTTSLDEIFGDFESTR